MGQVFDLPCSPTEKIILLALMDHAEHDGTRIFPTLEQLVRKTSCSRRMIQYVLRRFERLGALVVVAKEAGHRPREYRADLHMFASIREAARGAPVAQRNGCAAQPVTSDHRSGVQLATGADLAPKKLLKRTVSKRTVSTRVRESLEDFSLTDERRRFAEQFGCLNPAVQLDQFRDYWRGNGKVKKDWDATWRNWCRAHLNCACARPQKRAVTTVDLGAIVAAERKRTAS